MLEKISDKPQNVTYTQSTPCIHPEHRPPSHIVLSLGTYKYMCPACGCVTLFNILYGSSFQEAKP